MKTAMRSGGGRVRLGGTTLVIPLLLAVLLQFGPIALAHQSDPAQQAGTKPNIVLIVTDDQRWDSLWSMPTVQRKLVDHGVNFTNGFVVNSLCCPSRASILTGRYSHGTGVYTNDEPYGGFSRFKDSSTLATWLQAAGYQTALVGKYLNQYSDTTYIPPGWNEWDVVSRAEGVAYYNYRLNVNGTLKSFGRKARDYSTSVFTRKATKFMGSAPAPFFLYFAPSAPHTPAVPPPGSEHAFRHLKRWRPPSYNEPDVKDKPRWLADTRRLNTRARSDLDKTRKNQYMTLVAVDQAVKEIVSTLRETGHLHDTMIMFMSDNGYLWGEHRLRGKQAPYEESIRIPMVVRFDPLTTQARTDGNLALNIDVAPTFADLADVPAPSADGGSLLPLLGSAGAPWRSDFLIEHVASHPEIPTYCAVRNQQYLYVLYRRGDQELYDLAADPYQLENRAADPLFAGVVQSMRTRLGELCSPAPPGYSPP